MNKEQLFEEFLTRSTFSVPIFEFTFNLFIAFILSAILSYVYIKFGRSLSNRKDFSKNFPMLTMTTMLIITIVKSSLALSLGLVGALSIVRFRTALKEPEELTFTFLSIAIGLGLGASQTFVTIWGALIIMVVIIFKSIFFEKLPAQHLHLIISSRNPNQINFNEIVETLSKHCDLVNLKRLSEDKDHIESAISIDINKYTQLIDIKSDLRNKFPDLAVNFVDNSGILTS